MPVQTDIIEPTIDDLCALEPGLLLAGLMVLAKDMAEYSAVRALTGEEVQKFRRIYEETLNEDRYYWLQFGEGVFMSLRDTGLPYGFAVDATADSVNLSALWEKEEGEEIEIILKKAWTRPAGWDLLKAFKKDFSTALCQNDKTIRRFLDGVITEKKELATGITVDILEGPFSDTPHWYPLATHLGILIAISGVRAYCENTNGQNNGTTG